MSRPDLKPAAAEALDLIDRLRKLEPMLTHLDFTEGEAADACHGLYRFMKDALGCYADYRTREDIRDWARPVALNDGELDEVIFRVEDDERIASALSAAIDDVATDVAEGGEPAEDQEGDAR